MTDRLDAEEFITGFLAEAEEHLASANANLLSVEAAVAKGQATPRQVRELFRSLHTIKGLSAMVGVEPIVDVAHAMETVLREADRAAGQLPAGSVELLLEGVQAIEHRVQALAKRKAVPHAPRKLVEALTALRPSAVGSGPAPATVSLPPELSAKLSAAESAQLIQGIELGRRGVSAEFVPTAERAAAGITITSVRERVAELAEIVKVIPRALPPRADSPGGLAFALIMLTEADDAVIADAVHVPVDALLHLTVGATGERAGASADHVLGDDPVTGALDPPPDDELAGGRDGEEGGGVVLGGESRRRGVVRVEVSRLDDALEKLSALVVTRFRLVRAVAELGNKGADVRLLAQIVSENGRQLRDLRASIMRARMVSMSELLERVPLIVRGLSRTTGKQVTLKIDAGRAELDKAVAERIFPAIVHLVRNAVDHALEPPADRQRAGKDEAGLVRVSCFERSDSQLELSVSDDGRGIDRRAVAARAGTEVPGSDEALLALLTRPGLSTKTEVTTTSGRGVGMDIVKRITVDELGGELAVATTPGLGTTFTMRIPLSITIIDAFSFCCGGETFVVPVSMVEEIQEVDTARMVRGPDRRQSSRGADRRAAVRSTLMLERRGEAVPIISLDELFGLPADPDARRKAIVVRRNGEPFAFVVDRMLGQQEVVVRPLEDKLVRVDGISGTTDLGDGRPTLVLDLATLGGKLVSEARRAQRQFA